LGERHQSVGGLELVSGARALIQLVRPENSLPRQRLERAG
jgi:hypothetical protein